MTATALLLAFSFADPPALDAEDIRSGLVAEYRSLTDKATVTRIEPKPTFFLEGSSPHPRIPLGPFEVTWTGILSIRETGAIKFSAFVGGEVTVTLDDVVVLQGEAKGTRLVSPKEIMARPGFRKLSIRFRGNSDGPARLQLWWEGDAFAREPIPAWRFGHIAEQESPALKSDELARAGRAAVEKYGCARCHASAFPTHAQIVPGPSLANAGRLDRVWLMNWLADPHAVRPDTRMPGLFANDRAGHVERWLVAEALTGNTKRADVPEGDHRRGLISFVGLGCATCHFMPDRDRASQKELDRVAFTGLGDRMTRTDIVAFLADPHVRFPDGRMPKLAVKPNEARDIAAFLLLWSPTKKPEVAGPPTDDAIREVVNRLDVTNAAEAGTKLLVERGCTACHPGLAENKSRDVPIRKVNGGCLAERNAPLFLLAADVKSAIAADLGVASTEKHSSPYAERQRKLDRAGCVRCHQRDGDRPPPIEEIGSLLGGAHTQEVPFLRTPRLTNPHQKFTREHLAKAVREGASGLRWSRYTYRMPAYGADSADLVRALAEADGELPNEVDLPAKIPHDPTLGTLHGARLVGFQGYACASCHVWNGRLIGSPDPGATGPDLTRTVGRIRRDWFDRYLENPLRYYPGTPMPSIFPHGKPATLAGVLDGDAAKQKDALWALLAKGKDAPSPGPLPAVPIDAPVAGEDAIVAQIPIRLPDNRAIESISILTGYHDLLVYDLGEARPIALFMGARISRNVQGRIRQSLASGVATEFSAGSLLIDGKSAKGTFVAYDRLPNGVRLHWQLTGNARAEETVRIDRAKSELLRRIELTGLTNGTAIELNGTKSVVDDTGHAKLVVQMTLPKASTPPKWDGTPVTFADAPEGSLVRPGYRAIAYPRPKTMSGEDRVMPGAIAVRPKDGQVFVASMKTGELFTLRDPASKQAKFERYGQGLYQDALSMLAEDDGLYVLHRRNLTRIAERGNVPDRFDRVAALPHGVADTYDMAYGLARDRAGRFVFGYAPYANATMPGSGGALRLTPGQPPEPIAYGMRNPLGWCAGPDGEVFFTDNQGEWVASNKLAHVGEGVFHGFPNSSQKQHVSKPPGKPTVWVPYGWARSINGIAYDNTAGKFGPFSGQFFLAELMFGGAIVRANVEKVNGVWQGACFPFWGKGLLGPVTLAFDPRGPLYVGGITEPGWMALPDRGAVFRIDYTGETPFEMHSIQVLKQGFRITFTTPVNRATAGLAESYRLESYRYESTGAYGSPELDRVTGRISRAVPANDGLSVELLTDGLVKGRVYLLSAPGVRSAKDEKLVHDTGAYTLNEVPK